MYCKTKNLGLLADRFLPTVEMTGFSECFGIKGVGGGEAATDPPTLKPNYLSFRTK